VSITGPSGQVTLGVGQYVETFTITDPYGGSCTVTATVTVLDAPNQDPTATNYSTTITLNHGESSILFNWDDVRTALGAVDPDGDSVSIAGPSGQVTLGVGQHVETFTITDPYGGSCTATATVTVLEGPNQDPTATNYSTTITLNHGESSILFNWDDVRTALGAVDPDGDSVSIAGPSAQVTLGVGQYVETFTITDPYGGSCTATATVTVLQGPNQNPTATDFSATISLNHGETGRLFNWDDARTALGATDPDGDTISIDGPNYWETLGVGQHVRTYTITDNYGGSHTATATVDVLAGPNQDPTASDYETTVTIGRDETGWDVDWNGVRGVLGASDPDGDSISIEGPFGGERLPVGTTTRTFTITDSYGGSCTVTATINIENEANKDPTATDDDYRVQEGNTLEIAASGVLGNDTDPENDPLHTTLYSQPQNGTVVLNSDGSFRYTPNAGFRGEDRFQYTAEDGRGGSDDAIVRIFVWYFQVAEVTFSVPENSPPTTYVGGVCVDTNLPDAVEYEIVGGNDDDAFQIDKNSGVISVKTTSRLDHETRPQVVLTVRASTGQVQDEGQITIDVTDVNEAPKFSKDSYGTAENPIILNERVKPGPIEMPAGVKITASDPDRPEQELIYSIISPSDGYIYIHETAGVLMYDSSADMEVMQKTYHLKIKVEDFGSPSLSDTADVYLRYVPEVVITGDRRARESQTDTITISFTRLTTKLDQPLVVYYETIFGTASENAEEDDLFDDAEKTRLLDNESITIDPWETSATITLKAKVDNSIEKMEKFGVKVVKSKTDEKAYQWQVFGAPVPATEPGAILVADSDVHIFVVDGYTLFASHNDTPIFNDGALGGNNPGIHSNDIYQGRIGTCYASAAFMAAAEHDWQIISSRMEQISDHTFRVTLFNGAENNVGDRWKTFVVDMDQSNNYSMYLTGDQETDVDSPKYGYTEVWAVVLEKAYARLVSLQRLGFEDEERGYQLIGGGGWAAATWEALTGRTSTISFTNGMTSESVLLDIEERIAAGRTVMLQIKKEHEVAGIPKWHVLLVDEIVTGAGGAIVNLLNPWGGTRYQLQLAADDLDDAVVALEIVD
jgi:hypothetical protein